MQLSSKYLEAAVDQFSSLQGIGKRSSLRIVLQLLKREKADIEKFAHVLNELANKIQFCEDCGNITDHSKCSICQNPQRDDQILCVVEDIRDILAIEATSQYKGKYHVLNGIISPMDGIGPDDLNIPKLIERANNGMTKEIIFALSSTMEGDTTNFYLFKKLANTSITITTLSRGVAIGSEIQYADEITLGRSILQRMPYEASLKSN